MDAAYEEVGRVLERAVACFNTGEHERALAILDEVRGSAVEPAAVLLLRARLQQLGPAPDGGDVNPLAAVHELLQAACRIAPGDPAPFTELGYFQYAVLDQSAEAQAHFQHAVERAEEQYVAACVGLAKCLLDLGESDKAEQVARDLRNAFPERSFLDFWELDLPG